MALEAAPNPTNAHRILIQDAPDDQHGVTLYVWESPQSPLPDRDVRQVDTAAAKQFCKQYYGVDESGWREVPDEDMTQAGSMPVWYKTYRKKNPWTWFT